MDLTVLPTFGVAGALIIVIGYLLVSNRADRAQHLQVVDALIKHRDVEVDRLNKRIDQLETRVRTLEAEVDAEQVLRRAAEDKAAAAERRAQAVQDRREGFGV